GGSIVTIASMSAIRFLPSLHAYSASKAAVVHLTRGVAQELAARRIRVNCVAPGYVDTPMLQRTATETPIKFGLLKAGTPLNQRLITAEEIAESIFFLASDRSAMTTGAVLSVDGGFTAR